MDGRLDFTLRYARMHLQDFGRIDCSVVVVGDVLDVSQNGEAVLDLSTHGVSLSSTRNTATQAKFGSFLLSSPPNSIRGMLI